MRILIVTQQFWPENFRINDLAAELVMRGHKVTVLTGLPNYPQGEVFKEYRANPEHYATYEGVEIVRVPMIPRGSRKLTLMLNYLSFAVSGVVFGLSALRGRAFDVIFTYEPSPITVGIPAAALRFAKRAPMVFWVLDLWPETLSAVGAVRNPLLIKLVGLLVKAIYRSCDLILAQSKSFIAQIRKYAGPTRQLRYFPSWSESEFDMQHVQSAPEVVRGPNTFNVMFAGNIGVAQDFPSILAAVERLKHHAHIKWHIVGDGRMADWLAASVVERGLQDCITLYGRFPLERMTSFFRHADALLVCLADDPIFAMTIPGKVQTYLSTGLPVLGMLDGEGADLIKQSGSGLTCPAGDSEGLAKIVLQMSEMTATDRERMGMNGRAVMQSDFNRTHLIDTLEQWMSDLVTKKA
jgi:glycosyltransferase involved in cell wall biosynthesis